MSVPLALNQSIVPIPALNVPARKDPLAQPDPIVNKISTFTLRVFAELTISMGLNCGIWLFVAVPSIAAIYSTITFIALGSMLCVGARMYFESEFGQNDDDIDAYIPPIGEVIGRAGIVNTAGMCGINLWVHEAGHAIVAALCFVKPKIEVNVQPFLEGNTSYVVSNGMTKLGNFLGKHNSIMLNRGSGFIASTVFAMIEIAIAFFVKDKAPQVSLTLKCHAVSQIFSDLVYGYFALTMRGGFNLRNDYIALWRIGGIHPLIPMTLMVALPIIQYCGLKYFCSK